MGKRKGEYKHSIGVTLCEAPDDYDDIPTPKPKTIKQKKGKLIDTSNYIANNVLNHTDVPIFKQNPDENTEHFQKRMEEGIDNYIRSKEVESNFNVNMRAKSTPEGRVMSLDSRNIEKSERKKVKTRTHFNKAKLRQKVRKTHKKWKRVNDIDSFISGATLAHEDGNSSDEDCFSGYVRAAPDEVDVREKKLFRREKLNGEVAERPPQLFNKSLEELAQISKLETQSDFNGYLFAKQILSKQQTNGNYNKPATSSSPANASKETRKEVLQRERERAILAYRTIKASKAKRFKANNTETET